MIKQRCVLCNKNDVIFYHQDKKREYWQCQNCQLVQVPKAFLLSSAQEKAEYDKHDNQNDDIGYRRFLSRCLDPVLQRVSLCHYGLDFGCGEGQILSKMAQEAGLSMANFDLYYANDEATLNKRYDFITATEVIEHIYDAKTAFEQFDKLLNPNGFVALMTKQVIDADAFAHWHYKNDLTHVCFYSIKTFEWIAQELNWHLDVISSDVVIFSKGSPSN